MPPHMVVMCPTAAVIMWLAAVGICIRVVATLLALALLRVGTSGFAALPARVATKPELLRVGTSGFEAV
jgi:hypothetical protein